MELPILTRCALFLAAYCALTFVGFMLLAVLIVPAARQQNTRQVQAHVSAPLFPAGARTVAAAR